MGFCVMNNAAIVAAALAERGERVLIVDWDAHHGNGTQDIFYEDPRSLYVSMYPVAALSRDRVVRIEEIGRGRRATGTTINLPAVLRPGRPVMSIARTVDEVVAPRGRQGFAAHVGADLGRFRRSPGVTRMADLGLTSGDFADLTRRTASGPCSVVPAGRQIALLEGGYDLDALAASAGACVASMAGRRYRPEAGPNRRAGGARSVVDASVRRAPGTIRSAGPDRQSRRENLSAGSVRLPSTRCDSMVPARIQPTLDEVAPATWPTASPQAGFRLYLVGGVVRDALIGQPGRPRTRRPRPRPPTPRHPTHIEAMVGRLGRLGVDPGPALRHHRRSASEAATFEITTHRAEAYQPDSRKPDGRLLDRHAIEADPASA